MGWGGRVDWGPLFSPPSEKGGIESLPTIIYLCAHPQPPPSYFKYPSKEATTNISPYPVFGGGRHDYCQ